MQASLEEQRKAYIANQEVTWVSIALWKICLTSNYSNKVFLSARKQCNVELSFIHFAVDMQEGHARALKALKAEHEVH